MQQHDVDGTTTKKSDRDKAWPPNTPGARDKLHQPQNTNYLRDTRDNTKHMVFEVVPAVKPYSTNVELGLAQMETPDKTKSLCGEFTVLDLLTTEALVLLHFSLVHQ